MGPGCVADVCVVVALLKRLAHCQILSKRVSGSYPQLLPLRSISGRNFTR
jgi:hypothetical protein